MEPNDSQNQTPVQQQDDGRTVANMNVEGMPWYKPARDSAPQQSIFEELTPKERRAMIWGALRAALLVAAVFGGACFLFLLFCDKIWFR